MLTDKLFFWQEKIKKVENRERYGFKRKDSEGEIPIGIKNKAKNSYQMDPFERENMKTNEDKFT